MPLSADHPLVHACLRGLRQGHLDRRQFLARATALGLSAGAAYRLIGLPAPAAAQDQAQAPQGADEGGHLRMQMDVRPLTEPRQFDWPQLAFITAGWLEYLVSYHNDGSFHPMLLADWEVNANATLYRLHLRPGVTWNDGTAFTAADVARNIAGWCDTTLPGNSMAARFAVLIDPATGQAAADAIRVIDPLRVELHLPAPDITLIAGMADYPAAITPVGFDAANMLAAPVGTGPYLPQSVEPGVKAELVRNRAHAWWGDRAGMGARLARITYVDLGTDPARWLAAAAAGEIDMTYETASDYVAAFDALGWEQAAVPSAATIVIRANQQAEIAGARPFADKRLRQALAMAVDNAVCLELGYGGRGVVARNQHVGPMHPAWADVPALPHDPAAALALAQAAGRGDLAMELVSIDDDWRKTTTDAVAAQLRDAGFDVTRRVVPAASYWANWTSYPFSSTDWGHRPIDTQILGLAYRSGEAWNESGFANPEFDALLVAANAEPEAARRRPIMAALQAIMVEEGVVIQPYWRTMYRHARPGFTGWAINISYLPQITAIAAQTP